MAIESSTANVIDTVEDLKRLYHSVDTKNESEFNRTFPQSGIRMRISDALASEDQISSASPPISDEVLKRSRMNPHKDESTKKIHEQELPEGKT